MLSNIKNKILINKKSLIVVFFLGSITNAYAAIDSNNEQGSLHVDSTTYEIIHREQTMIKIYGTVNEIHGENRLNILIILPDGLTTGQLIMPKSNGYFETFFIIDEDSQIGNYQVIATYERAKMGEINFKVNEKEYSPEELLSAREILEQVNAKRDEQKAAELAAEQKAAELAIEQKAAELAIEQKAAELAIEQKAAELAIEQKAAELAAEQKVVEQKVETIQKDEESPSYSGVIILMLIVAGIIVLRKIKKNRKKQSSIISHTKPESKQDYREEVKDEKEDESEWRGI